MTFPHVEQEQAIDWADWQTRRDASKSLTMRKWYDELAALRVRRGRPIKIAEADVLFLRTMRRLNREGMPMLCQPSDTVRKAVNRWTRGMSLDEHLSFFLLPDGEQRLILNHERAVLAWLSIKAKGLLLDQWLADALRSLAKNWCGVSL